MPANLENSAVATGVEKSVFIPIPKKGNAKECSNYFTIALISHAGKVMLKILQAWLQQYVNRELPDVQAGFRKGRGTKDQIAHIRWIMEKAREFQKNIYFFFIDYAKAFDCMDHHKLWKILKEMGIPDHLTCLLRNLTRAQCLSSPHPGVRDSRDWGHSDSSIQKAQKYNWTQTLAKVPDHTGDREAYNNHALTFESWEVQVDLWVLCAQSLRHIHLFPIPWTVARQAPLSMGFSKQKY